LAEVERNALTTISAPAGFGKTTLLAEWFAQTSCPLPGFRWIMEIMIPIVSWLTLFPALESIHENVGFEARQIMQSIQSVPPHIILASLI